MRWLIGLLLLSLCACTTVPQQPQGSGAVITIEGGSLLGSGGM